MHVCIQLLVDQQCLHEYFVMALQMLTVRIDNILQDGSDRLQNNQEIEAEGNFSEPKLPFLLNLKCSMQPESKDSQILKMNPEEAPNQLAPQVSIHNNNRYKLLLINFGQGKILPMTRLKVLWWMMQRAHSLPLSRTTYSHACYLLDLYIQKMATINLESLQILGFVCLRLAAKLQNICLTCLDYSSNELAEWEKHLFLSLGYLLPETYILLIDEIADQWDIFIGKTSNQQHRFLIQTEEGHKKMINLYDKLDCLNLVVHSLKFSYGQLCFNLFYVINYFYSYDSDSINFSEESLAQQIIRCYNINEVYFQKFQEFMKGTIRNKSYCLDLNIGFFLIPFLRLEQEIGQGSATSIKTQTAHPSVRRLAVDEVRKRIMP